MPATIVDEKGASLSRRLLLRNRKAVNPRGRQRAVLHWIDWIGCVAAGARTPEADALQAWRPQPRLAPAFASLLGPAQDPFQALLMEAGPAQAEDMDDLHRRARLRPGAVVLPALASLARSRGIPARQMLDATVRGYETSIRIGRAVGARHHFHWHASSTAGVFGAAAACADALRLPLDAAVGALGHAGTQAAGLRPERPETAMSSQLSIAHAAWAGVTAATLALAGFTGPERILEGPHGFLAAMTTDADTTALVREDADWLIHSTSFQPWPGSRHTHAAIDCVLALREAGGRCPLVFDSCEVAASADALATCDNPRPATRTEARFSLQYAVAAAAALGPLRPEHFDELFFARPDLVDSASRVRLALSPAADAAHPDHYGAQVSMDDYRSHSVQDSLGDPERPLSSQAVFDKARMLMRYGGVPPARIDDLLAAAGRLMGDAVQDEPLAQPMPAALLAPLFG